MNDLISTAREYLESIACCDFKKIKQLLHEKYTYTTTDGQVYNGPDKRFDTAGMTLNAFPDLSFEFRNFYHSGHVVITELIMRGTYQGDIRTLPDADNKLALPACSIIEISDGLILTEREYYDQTCLTPQLDVVDSSREKVSLSV